MIAIPIGRDVGIALYKVYNSCSLCFSFFALQKKEKRPAGTDKTGRALPLFRRNGVGKHERGLVGGQALKKRIVF